MVDTFEGLAIKALAYHTRRRATGDLGGEQALDERQREVDHEGERGRVYHRGHRAALAADQLDEAVGDEAGADAVGDRVGERHHPRVSSAGNPSSKSPKGMSRTTRL